MKKHAQIFFGILVLIALVQSFFTEVLAAQQFTIMGELRPEGISIHDGSVGMTAANTKGMDFKQATEVVTHDVMSVEGGKGTVELVSRQFQNGFVNSNGKIEDTLDAKMLSTQSNCSVDSVLLFLDSSFSSRPSYSSTEVFLVPSLLLECGVR